MRVETTRATIVCMWFRNPIDVDGLKAKSTIDGGRTDFKNSSTQASSIGVPGLVYCSMLWARHARDVNIFYSHHRESAIRRTGVVTVAQVNLGDQSLGTRHDDLEFSE